MCRRKLVRHTESRRVHIKHKPNSLFGYVRDVDIRIRLRIYFAGVQNDCKNAEKGNSKSIQNHGSKQVQRENEKCTTDQVSFIVLSR